MLGSEHNDEFYMSPDGEVRTRTNRCACSLRCTVLVPAPCRALGCAQEVVSPFPVFGALRGAPTTAASAKCRQHAQTCASHTRVSVPRKLKTLLSTQAGGANALELPCIRVSGFWPHAGPAASRAGWPMARPSLQSWLLSPPAPSAASRRRCARGPMHKPWRGLLAGGPGHGAQRISEAHGCEANRNHTGKQCASFDKFLPLEGKHVRTSQQSSVLHASCFIRR